MELITLDIVYKIINERGNSNAVAEEKMEKSEENMSWEEYITELNEYAQSLKYSDAIAMREDLLNRTATVFFENLNKDKIDELGGEEKAMFSIKSALKKLTVDTLKTADWG